MGVPSPLSGKMPTHSVSFQPWVAMRSSQLCTATPSSTNSRTAMRMLFHIPGAVRVGRRRLRLQEGGRPGAGAEGAAARGFQVAPPQGTVVDARLALDPQLHRVGPQPIAAPVRRARGLDLHALIGTRAAR